MRGTAQCRPLSHSTAFEEQRLRCVSAGNPSGQVQSGGKQNRVDKVGPGLQSDHCEGKSVRGENQGNFQTGLRIHVNSPQLLEWNCEVLRLEFIGDSAGLQPSQQSSSKLPSAECYRGIVYLQK